MASVKTTGIDIFARQFSKLAQEITHINKGALGEAAGMVADKMEAALQTMPVRGGENTLQASGSFTERQSQKKNKSLIIAVLRNLKNPVGFTIHQSASLVM